MVTGAISASGEVDRYVFTVTDRARVYFDNRTNASVTWQLVGPRGTVFGPRDMRSSDGPDGFLTTELVPGTYQLTLSGTVAPYSFRIVDFASATPIDIGTPVLNQTLNPANASALYRFEGTAGQRLYYDLRQMTNGDGRTRLFGPLGNQIWDTGLGSDVGPFTLPRAGTYTLVFEGRYYYPTGTTTFGFNLQPIEDAAPLPLVLGDRVDGAIATIGETDAYTFTLAERTLVAFDSLADIDLRWTLAGPNGKVVSDRSLRSSDAFDGYSVFTLTAGTYTLSVTGPGKATGNYAFRLLDLGIGAVIVPDVTAAGTLSPGNETDVYRFDGIAGGRYFFDVISAGTTDAAWRLLDPYGGQVWGQGFTDVDVRTLAFTGTYSLLIEGRRYNTGANAYAVAIHSVRDDTQTLTVGEPQGVGVQVAAGRLGEHAAGLPGLASLEVPHSSALDLRSVVTVEAWLQVEGFTNTWMPVFYKGDGGSARTYSLWINANGSVLFSTNDASGSQGVQTAAGSIVPGRWQHVAAVMDRPNGVLRIFIDGVEAATGAVRTGLAATYATPLVLGDTRESNASYSPFLGRIDEVRVWSVARTQSQIAAARDAALAADDRVGLALYLPLDEPGGPTRADASANAAVATLRDRVGALPDAVVGAIARPGQVDRYTFSLAERRQFYFDVLTDTPGVAWTLSSPTYGTVVSGRGLQSSDAIDGYPLLDLGPGDWTLTLDGNGDTTAVYAFRLVDRATAAVLEPGVTTTAVLSPGTATRLFRFDVAAGERWYLDGLSWSGGDIRTRVLTPYGDDAVSNVFANGDAGPVTFSVPGTYYLSVEGRRNQYGTSQSLTFRLDRLTDRTTRIAPGEALGVAPDWITGPVGGALAFDGLEQLDIANGAAVDLRDDLTIELWLRADAFGDPWSSVLYKGSGSNARTYALWLNNAGYLHYTSVGGPLGTVTLSSPSGSIRLGEWVHAAVVADRAAGALRMYLDGVEVASTTLAATPFVESTGGLRVGAASGESYPRLVGAVDELRLWSVARSGSEIAAGRSGPLNGDEPGLALYLPFDEGAGTAVANSAAATSAATSGGALTHLLAGAEGAVVGAIARPGEVERFTFSLAERRQFYFDALTDTSALSWSLTSPTYGTLVSGRGFQASDSADGYPLLDLGAGDYTLTFGFSGDTTGAYAFRLIDRANAVPIALDAPVTAELVPGSETRLYRFEAAGGERLFFDATAFSGSDVRTRLLDPFGAQIWSNVFNGGDNDVTTLVLPGTYYLSVEGRRNQLGTNQSLTFTLRTVTDDATAIAVGEDVAGAIAVPGQIDRYGFSLDAPKLLYLDALSSTPIAWSLVSAATGAVVSGKSFTGSDSSDGLSVLSLAAGNYTLVFDMTGDDTGAYAFRLIDLGAAPLLAPGTPQTATLDPASESAAYRLEANAGDRFFFDMQAPGIADGRWRLISPYGDLLADAFITADFGEITATNAGTHYLVIEGRRTQTGTSSYTFNVEFRGNTPPTPPAGTAAALGDLVTGSISAVGEIDQYVFTLAAPTRVVFDNRLDTTVQWSMTGPRGTVVDWASCGSPTARRGSIRSSTWWRGPTRCRCARRPATTPFASSTRRARSR